MLRNSRGKAFSIQTATTPELLDELRRRSLGCLFVCVRAEEGGDAWLYQIKGSPLLLGAMSAALQLQIQRAIREQ